MRCGIIRRAACLAAALALLTAAVSCGSSGNLRPTAGTSGTQAGGRHPTPSATSPSPTPTPSPPPPPGRVVLSHFRAADGTRVTLATFAGAVTYRLHGGSADPGYPAIAGLHGGPAISRTERHTLVAAFNGGFKLSAGAGGYEQEGRVISRIIRGLASLVIYRSGAAAIGTWGSGLRGSGLRGFSLRGSGLPKPGDPVYSVRQNLHLLVSDGRVTAAASDWGAWGATLGGGEYVARSAVGQNAAGNLIFAGSMSASPSALAAALVHAHARVAMELDINPEWVQLDVARKPGALLRVAIPGQNRPADQYVAGWTRDFITVLAIPPSH